MGCITQVSTKGKACCALEAWLYYASQSVSHSQTLYASTYRLQYTFFSKFKQSKTHIGSGYVRLALCYALHRAWQTSDPILILEHGRRAPGVHDIE